MSYTDADVERVAEAIANELRTPSHAFTGGGTPMPPPVEGIHLRIARAALEAMEREPIKDAGILSLHVDRLGRTFYARGLRHRDNMTVEYSVTGATIDEAIRAAVAAAKGGE